MCVGAIVLIDSNNDMNVCKFYYKLFEIVVHDGILFSISSCKFVQNNLPIFFVPMY
jgi:hypothetical protein